MVAPSVARLPGRGAGGLDVGREAEPEVAALRQRLGLLLAEALVVEDLDGLLEGVGGRARCHRACRWG